MAGNNIFNNGSLDDFATNLGGAITTILSSDAVSNAAGAVIAGMAGVGSIYSNNLGDNAGAKPKDLKPRTGIKKFFTFYKMNEAGVMIYDSKGERELDWPKVIGIPLAIATALYIVYRVVKSLFFPKKSKKSSQKVRKF